MEWWTNDPSLTSNPPTSPDLLNATSSPALEDGASPCDWPDGGTIDMFGVAPVLASHSATPEQGRAQPTNGTSGPSSSTSSASAGRESSSASRSHPPSLSEKLAEILKRRTARFGSMEYSQTWKRRVTPQGRAFWAHTASARRISDKDSTGWATPRAEDAESSGMRHSRGVADTLTVQASMAGWPTASARDWKDTPGMATEGTNPDGSTRSRLDQLPRVAALCLPQTGDCPVIPAGWATPMAGTPAQNGNNAAGDSDYSRMVTSVTGWPTPNAMQGGQTSRSGDRKDEPLMGGLVTGLTPIGSSAETASTAGFQLNPHFSLWLQGYPTSWHDAGVSALRSLREPATQSSLKSQPSSSAPSKN